MISQRDLNRLAARFRRLGLQEPYSFAKDLYWFLEQSGENGVATEKDDWCQYFDVSYGTLYTNLKILKVTRWLKSHNEKGIIPSTKWKLFIETLDTEASDNDHIKEYKIDFLRNKINFLRNEIKNLEQEILELEGEV